MDSFVLCKPASVLDLGVLRQPRSGRPATLRPSVGSERRRPTFADTATERRPDSEGQNLLPNWIEIDPPLLFVRQVPQIRRLCAPVSDVYVPIWQFACSQAIEKILHMIDGLIVRRLHDYRLLVLVYRRELILAPVDVKPAAGAAKLHARALDAGREGGF